jgi:hypothetical protein
MCEHQVHLLLDVLHFVQLFMSEVEQPDMKETSVLKDKQKALKTEYFALCHVVARLDIIYKTGKRQTTG